MLDETICAYIILRTPNQPEDELISYVTRLAIQLEIQAYGFQPQDVSRDTSPARNEDVLWSGTVETSKKPSIITGTETDEFSSQHMLAIWKTSIALSMS